MEVRLFPPSSARSRSARLFPTRFSTFAVCFNWYKLRVRKINEIKLFLWPFRLICKKEHKTLIIVIQQHLSFVLRRCINHRILSELLETPLTSGEIMGRAVLAAFFQAMRLAIMQQADGTGCWLKLKMGLANRDGFEKVKQSRLSWKIWTICSRSKVTYGAKLDTDDKADGTVEPRRRNKKI